MTLALLGALLAAAPPTYEQLEVKLEEVLVTAFAETRHPDAADMTPWALTHTPLLPGA